MSTIILNKYNLGDMQACYYLDEETRIAELMLLPAGMEAVRWEEKNQEADSLIQIKLTGDIYPGGYAGGGTLRQGESTRRLKYAGQTKTAEGDAIIICTSLKDARGYEAVHYLVWKKEADTLRSYVEFKNDSNHAVKVEMLSSFSLAGITPFLPGDAHESINIHRIRSVWSMEGSIESRTIEELQLEPSWAGHAVRSERFGQAGSLPVNHYFPYLVVEDKVSNVFWGMQVAHNASWQIELYRKDDGLSVSGGQADREFGHWVKTIEPGEIFTVPEAILTVCQGGTVDDVSQRLTSAGQEYADQGPESEQNLPVIFNEYCTTWGCPSHENISTILEHIKDKGFEYFVIDCGWYKKEGIPWDIMMGDYEVSSELFPDGLQATADAIKAAGMKPGIWFEIDNIGSEAEAYQMEEHLLKRDGVPITTTMRRFWDMTDPWVEAYLSEKVIGTLRKYGFQYMKMDYNDTIGIGCDHRDSLGEGLRKNMEASLGFIKKVKEEVPGIILENCASGGQKQEPLMMGTTSMSSFSDAHECDEIPIIAANLHRVILPRQSQIWAVIRKEDSLKRIAYSIAAAFLGRMCISGDVTELNTEQWELIDKGIAFYKQIAPVIKHGHTYWYGSGVKSYRHPSGWQAILRVGNQKNAFLVIHTFGGELPGQIAIDLKDSGSYQVEAVYSHSETKVKIEGQKLYYTPEEEMSAAAVYLSKE